MTLEKQCNNFDNERKDFEMQLRTVQGKLDDEMEKSKHLSEAITQKEMELNEVLIHVTLFYNLTVSRFFFFVLE